MNQIRFQNVSKSFGDTKAVDSLSITIQEGDIYAFLGHNGAGKTTCLRLLLGLLQPNTGAISVFGNDTITHGDLIRSFCGVVTEDVGLYEPLSLYDNLLFYTDIYGLSRKEANQRIDELLEFFDLKEQKLKPVKGFSTGMKKKSALIRAMLHEPKLLLLDEPTNGLDPVSTVNLRNKLMELTKQKHTTMIMTTHNLEEVQKLCNKISIFRKGHIIYSNELSKLSEASNGTFQLEELYLALERGCI